MVFEAIVPLARNFQSILCSRGEVLVSYKHSKGNKFLHLKNLSLLYVPNQIAIWFWNAAITESEHEFDTFYLALIY